MTSAISAASAATAPAVMSGASTRMPPQQKMTSLFQKIDTNGSGSITKDQLQQAFSTMNPPAPFANAGVDAVFSKLAPQGTGSVSQSDFVNGMKNLMVSLRADTQSLSTLGG